MITHKKVSMIVERLENSLDVLKLFKTDKISIVFSRNELIELRDAMKIYKTQLENREGNNDKTTS